ncbi:hypothetical protein CBOM_07401 [Ceraceosorus bombacis]|uniref:Uncharacterized protein n=1 Tax=Ceraceosorus bombacis TaxID=401625 RepID=A0A0P1B868_9BASI|nr:hypothetical protein CBOM_07401 [Ceraceosorus bombacis]
MAVVEAGQSGFPKTSCCHHFPALGWLLLTARMSKLSAFPEALSDSSRFDIHLVFKDAIWRHFSSPSQRSEARGTNSNTKIAEHADDRLP